ncbi:MAG: ATP-binding cassette subfamily F protein uup [Bradymonadia bacterium]
MFGRNGEGKSTLLNIICGKLKHESGVVDLQRGSTLGWLEQSVPEGQAGTVSDVVAQGLGVVSKRIHDYKEALSLVTEDPSESNLGKLDRTQTAMEAAGGWEIQERIESVISRLGLDGDVEFASLSGGWRRRAFLAAALVQRPDVLVLDEPTNHLDVEAIEWLEQELTRYQGALVFVTHDRAFLRAIASRIVELDRGKLTEYPADFDAFKERKEHDLSVESGHNSEFDKKLAIEETWIRTGIKARRTRNEGRVRALKKLREERSQRRNRKGKARMTLHVGEKSGREVVVAEDVHFGYGDEKLVDGFSTIIGRGDRIGLIGPNGVGKTTLLRLLLGEIEPQSGEIELGTKLEIRYFDQLRAALDPNQTVANTLAPDGEHVFVGGVQKHVISYLRDFLFDDIQARQPVRLLSGGERNRLLLAKLFALPSNVLVMDEPTNDLDLETLELLENLLLEFPGTVLVVSHDREFLDNIVTDSFIFEGNAKITRLVGGYSEWEEIRAERRAEEAAQSKKAADKRKAESGRKKPAAAPKLSSKEKRELADLPSQLEKLERQAEAIRAELADPHLYKTDQSKANSLLNKLKGAEAKLATAYERWESLEAKA